MIAYSSQFAKYWCFAFITSIAACSSTPAPKDWSANTFSGQQSATKYLLLGETKKAQAAISQLRKDLAATARTDLAAKTELALCAIEQASLKMPPCEAFEKLKIDALPAELAYAQFLSGQWVGLQVALLPEQYQAMVQHSQPESQLIAIKSPISRLIAGSVLLQKNQLSAKSLELMVDTASQEGWRKPVLAWLNIQFNIFEKNNATEQAQQIKRRIQMLEQTLY